LVAKLGRQEKRTKRNKGGTVCKKKGTYKKVVSGDVQLIVFDRRMRLSGGKKALMSAVHGKTLQCEFLRQNGKRNNPIGKAACQQKGTRHQKGGELDRGGNLLHPRHKQLWGVGLSKWPLGCSARQVGEIICRDQMRGVTNGEILTKGERQNLWAPRHRARSSLGQ